MDKDKVFVKLTRGDKSCEIVVEGRSLDIGDWYTEVIEKANEYYNTWVKEDSVKEPKTHK